MRAIQDKEGIPTYQQRLTYAGRLMESRRALSTYYVGNEAVEFLQLRQLRLQGGGPSTLLTGIPDGGGFSIPATGSAGSASGSSASGAVAPNVAPSGPLDLPVMPGETQDDGMVDAAFVAPDGRGRRRNWPLAGHGGDTFDISRSSSSSSSWPSGGQRNPEPGHKDPPPLYGGGLGRAAHAGLRWRERAGLGTTRAVLGGVPCPR
eukprot:7916720-Pyramimonas_sp.AAC.1